MKKRIGTLITISASLFLLTSCGGDPQSEFISHMEKQARQTEGTWDFKMGIEELEMTSPSDTATNPMTNMLTTQLKDMNVTGVIKSSVKSEVAFDMDMKINALGMEIPFHMLGTIGKEPKMYMATDIMEYVMTVVGSITGSPISNEVDYGALKGKYMDILEVDETIDQTSFDKLTTELKESQKENEELQKKVRDYIKGLDKKTFTKKDDVISHIFSKKEFEEIITLISKESGPSKKELTKGFKEFENISMMVNFNTKKDQSSMTFTLVPSKNQVDSVGLKSITLAFDMTLKDKKADITLPKKGDILTEEALKKYFPEPTNLSSDVTITDEDFNDLKTAITGQKEVLDDETKEELLRTYKEVLSEEQYKEMEELLK